MNISAESLFDFFGGKKLKKYLVFSIASLLPPKRDAKESGNLSVC